MKISIFLSIISTIIVGAYADDTPKTFEVLPLLNVKRSDFLVQPGDWYITRYGNEDDTYRYEYVELIEVEVDGVKTKDYKVVGYITEEDADTSDVYGGCQSQGLRHLSTEDEALQEDSFDPHHLASTLDWNGLCGGIKIL